MANGVFWLGANGNVYVKGSQGTNSAGLTDKNTVSYWTGKGFSQIDDPNPPKVVAPAQTDTTSQTTLPDRSGDIAYQNAGLQNVDSGTAGALSKIDTQLAQLNGTYDTEATANNANYKTNSDQNQNNLQKNKETALVNAAQGRQGLLGQLASLGALNGSGVTLANRAVQNGANADLSGASDTYGSNKTSLDNAIGAFTAEDKERRDQASQEAADAKTNAQNDADKTKQSYYSAIANDYEQQGDHANAAKYQGLASSLFPDINATNIPSSNIVASSAAYTPASLASYQPGASTVVNTTPAANGTATPGLVATTAAANKKKTATAITV